MFLIYLCNGLDSVFDSQVLELLNKAGSSKYFNGVYLVIGIKNNLESQMISQKQIHPSIKLIYFKSFPNYPIFNHILRKNLSEVLRINNLIGKNFIFHVRGEILSWHLAKVLGKQHLKKILPDVRGATIEEVKQYKHYGIIKKNSKLWNFRKAVKELTGFEIISVVSEALKNYLIKTYKIKSDCVVIVPGLAGAKFSYNTRERLKIRNELGLEEKDILIVFSSGGLQNWQNNKVLKILADKDIKILNLSKGKIVHRNIRNKFIDYAEMPGYLNAGDIAIIWREKNIVNEVASPVKFSEYICCGLPVISNNSVKMIRDYIKESSFGIILNDLNEVTREQLLNLKIMDRNSIAVSARKWLSVDTIYEHYKKIYNCLHIKNPSAILSSYL